MTTITVDSTVNLPKTHFRDMEELVQALAERYAFERSVEESVRK